jgi:arylsulfatase A-like enzyme
MLSRRNFLQLAGIAGTSAVAGLPSLAQTARPNIIVILADDLGYGDTGPYGATKLKTPNLDRLAKRGLRFTNAYCTTATCTPTRYSLLTGEYAFRNRRAAVLPGNAPMLISPGRHTVASVLKQAGYNTGVVGKWHLGLGDGNVDWNKDVKPGPETLGFDYSFLIPATGDRTPCVYVENGKVVGLDPQDPITVQYDAPIPGEPTGVSNPGLLRWHPSHGHDMTVVNGISRIGYMKGGTNARWVDEGMADTITLKAKAFIAKHAAAARNGTPFFLYFCTNDIHVPRVPHPRFQGKSDCGIRCDATVQLDWSVGQILEALDEHLITENTLVVFTSDNGPVIDDGYEDGAFEDLNDHTPAGELRGSKYSIYEAGTRMPFIVSWPGRVTPGVTNAMVSQVDFVASFAALAGASLPAGAGPDSENVLPALLGETEKGRESLVQQAGQMIALRRGRWKYIPAHDRAVGNKTWNRASRPAGMPAELYDLENDPSETTNIAHLFPDVVKQMHEELERIRAKPQVKR